MSYYASGSGYIDVGSVCPPEQALRDLAEHGGLDSRLVEPNQYSPYYTIDVVHEYGDYSEEEVIDFLSMTGRALQILDGTIEFTGEDDLHWRFVWNGEDGCWYEQNGSIEYESPGTAI